MAEMTESQVQAFAKESVFGALFGAVDGAVRYDTGKFAIPVKCEGVTRYVKVALVTAKADFDLDDAVADYDVRKAAAAKRVADAEAKRKAKAEEKAKKEAEKAEEVQSE